MIDSIPIKLLILTNICLLTMYGVWLRQRKTGSITIVDFADLGCTVAPLVLLALGSGDKVRRLIAGACIALWAAVYLAPHPTTQRS